MITLSFSTISMLYKSSHGWINKKSGIPQPPNPHFINGHRIHRIIQDYICGKKMEPALAHIKHRFPIVEEMDFDERCKFEFKVNDKYGMRGFMDGQDPEGKRFMEIKTSDPMWSIGKFVLSPQRKIYALAKPDYTEGVLIAALPNEQDWERIPPRVYPVPLTDRDRKEALEWIMGGIAILEDGKFNGGLDENGKCNDRFCNWGSNCLFYKP